MVALEEGTERCLHLFPFAGTSWSAYVSVDVPGRGLADIIRDEVDWLYEVCGRALYAERGREPGPTLLEKLPLDVFRDDTDAVRELRVDTDEENEVFRVI